MYQPIPRKRSGPVQAPTLIYSIIAQILLSPTGQINGQTKPTEDKKSASRIYFDALAEYSETYVFFVTAQPMNEDCFNAKDAKMAK